MTKPRRHDPLSDRELEIIRLIAGGLTNKQVGEELGITFNTVKNHFGNISAKTGIHDRTTLSRVWARNDLLDELIEIAPVDANDLEARKEKL